MEVKPIHILAASVAAFCVLVAAQVFVTNRDNEQFREKFSNIDFAPLRKRVIAEENMQEAVEANIEEDEDD